MAKNRSKINLNPFKALSNFVPKKSKDIGAEIGATGTPIFAGIPMTEYLTDLRFPESMKVYDRMFRSDGMVAAVYYAMTLPIRSTKWTIQPAKDGDVKANKAIAKFIEDNLFGGMKYSWDDTLRDALTFLLYGFSIQEIVLRYDTYKGRPAIMVDKLAPRVQLSIWRFPQDEAQDVVAIEQLDQVTGKLYEIPLEKCVMFTNNRIGNDPTGISMFRHAYQAWYYKSGYRQILALGVEKNALGTPVGWLPENGSEGAEQKLEQVLGGIRAADDAALILPHGVDVKMLEQTRPFSDAILHAIQNENEEIANSALAGFLMLGHGTSGGSYSLGRATLDLFLMSLGATAEYVRERFQKVIDMLVELNFGKDVEKPRLAFQRIQFNDPLQAAEALGKLGSGHALFVDKIMQDHIRDWFGIPPIPEDALRNQQALPPNRYTPEVVPDDKMPAPPAGPDPGRDPNDPNGPDKGPGGGKRPSSLQASEDSTAGREGSSSTRSLAEPAGGNSILSSRPAWENVVRFDETEKELDSAEAAMAAYLMSSLPTAVSEIIENLRKHAENNGSDDLKGAGEIQQVMVIAGALAKKMQSLYQYGWTSAQNEASSFMQNLSHATPQDSDIINRQAYAMAQSWADRLKNSAVTAMLSAQSKGLTPEQSLTTAKNAALASITERSTQDSASSAAMSALSAGRQDAMTLHSVRKMAYSAVLDKHTCKLCASLDGKVISTDDPRYEQFQPPLHGNCRCMWIPVPDDTAETWTDPDPADVSKHGRYVPMLSFVSHKGA